jgi:hypothetical protein
MVKGVDCSALSHSGKTAKPYRFKIRDRCTLCACPSEGQRWWSVTQSISMDDRSSKVASSYLHGWFALGALQLIASSSPSQTDGKSS